jgi:hypothetical protein
MYLEKLFGSKDKVRLIRFFLKNQTGFFEEKEICKKLNIKPQNFKKEITNLINIKLVLKNKEKKVFTFSDNKNEKAKSKDVMGYRCNPEFAYKESLYNLVFDYKAMDKEYIYEMFKKVGKTKLFLLGGVFVGDLKARVDILYVGDSIKKVSMDKALEGISAEMGGDIKIAIFDSEEFDYRKRMFDKFLKDIFSAPHEKMLAKISF